MCQRLLSRYSHPNNINYQHHQSLQQQTDMDVGIKFDGTRDRKLSDQHIVQACHYCSRNECYYYCCWMYQFQSRIQSKNLPTVHRNFLHKISIGRRRSLYFTTFVTAVVFASIASVWNIGIRNHGVSAASVALAVTPTTTNPLSSSVSTTSSLSTSSTTTSISRNQIQKQIEKHNQGTSSSRILQIFTSRRSRSAGVGTTAKTIASLEQNKGTTVSTISPTSPNILVNPLDVIKTGLAGGIAGATGTALLYPFDAAKTLRQSSPGQFRSVFAALRHLLLYNSDTQGQIAQQCHQPFLHQCHYQTHVSAGNSLKLVPALTPTSMLASVRSFNFARVYKGLWASVIGSIPSSALYFGSYETCKVAIRNHFERLNRKNAASVPTTGSLTTDDEPFYQRLLIHACAAASGNVVSSAVFVPKELIKQKMQYTGTKSLSVTIQKIIQDKGYAGLYCGYKAVLIRNIPTAAIRFCLYEELRRIVLHSSSRNKKRSHDSKVKNYQNQQVLASSSEYLNTQVSWQLFAAGAMAGAIASGIMTPIDVLKTRMATGLCSIEAGGLIGCVRLVMQDSGWQSLYAGAGSRIFFSAAFSGIGFGTFEITKSILGVSTSSSLPTTITTTPTTTPTMTTYSQPSTSNK